MAKAYHSIDKAKTKSFIKNKAWASPTFLELGTHGPVSGDSEGVATPKMMS